MAVKQSTITYATGPSATGTDLKCDISPFSLHQQGSRLNTIQMGLFDSLSLHYALAEPDPPTRTDGGGYQSSVQYKNTRGSYS